MTRILTYNIHRCVGTDRRLDVGRIAAVIAAERPDIVALQEVDVGRARTGGVEQAQAIAVRLGMAFRFHAALQVEAESYGDAILTALPERLIRAGALPGHPRFEDLEPRGALWVAIDVGGVELQVVNTHLGLIPREQRLQVAALVGPRWLTAPERRDPLILLGDFNASRFGQPYRLLTTALKDVTTESGAGRRIATFPSLLPMRQLDHVFASPAVEVRSVHASATPLARQASDHLPLVLDFALTTGSATPRPAP